MNRLARKPEMGIHTRIYVWRSRAPLLGALLLALCWPTGHALASESPEEFIQRAERAFDQSDLIGAMNWYRKAAEQGHAAAQSRLAYLLDNAEENEAAVDWYRKAAEQQFAEAEFGLARMYATGEGVTRDNEAAVSWFTRAARQGHLPAIHVLALAYEKGELGLTVDYEHTVRWLQTGVEHADSWSIKRLARAYRNGELGLRYEPEQARLLEESLPVRQADNGHLN